MVNPEIGEGGQHGNRSGWPSWSAVVGRAATWAGSVALLALAGVGAVVTYVVRRQPARAMGVLGGRGPVLFATRSSTRQVAITIDDGPTRALTPRLLEVLAAHGARATFFMLGSEVEDHPDIVREVVAGGHEIGNHGWTDRPAGLQTRAGLADDLARTSSAIEGVTGIRPRFMRPGSGWMRPGHLRDVRAGGETVALGSIAVLDLEVRDPGRELSFILARVQPGAIIVLHDGRGQRTRFAPLLDGLLTELTARDYQCVTLSALVDGAASRPTSP